MEFLENLDALLQERNMNRSQLAVACELSTSTVNSWWNRGCENVSMKTLIKLSKFFNCTIDELVSGVKSSYTLKEFGTGENSLVFTLDDYSRNELKLIALYAEFLKSRHVVTE